MEQHGAMDRVLSKTKTQAGIFLGWFWVLSIVDFWGVNRVNPPPPSESLSTHLRSFLAKLHNFCPFAHVPDAGPVSRWALGILFSQNFCDNTPKWKRRFIFETFGLRNSSLRFWVTESRKYYFAFSFRV